MSNKTRRHIWSVPLVASIAVIGALAALLVLASPGAILAQDTSPTLCEQWMDIQGDDNREARADFLQNNPSFKAENCQGDGETAPAATAAMAPAATVGPAARQRAPSPTRRRNSPCWPWTTVRN